MEEKQNEPKLEEIKDRTLHIEISKFKSLHEILESPAKVFCILIFLIIFTVAIFSDLGSL